MKVSKRFKTVSAKVDAKKFYALSDAVQKLKETASTKFTESVDIAVRLGVDPKKADQAIRSTVSLPHGIGKTVRVLVVAKPPLDQEARDAGADFAGYQEYLEKLQAGWTDIDVIIASPDVMGDLGRLGKILGPRGLMPNPKSGTVTPAVGKAVKEIKAGKIEFRVDKAGVVHAMVGKSNFESKKLEENISAFLHTILRLKPSSVKGQYIKSISLSNTMGPGIAVDRAALGMMQ
ncbi:MAG: 50S ribosomal protein L1 [Ignavibacteriales bacterium]|nr:50S ribosomal protein L1 [Ignavibacteriales bacterium]